MLILSLLQFCPYKVSKEKMTLRRSGGLQFFVRQQTPLLLDSYPSPCYTTRFFEPNFKKHAVVFCKPLLLGISPKNLVLMKVKHLLFLGKLLGLRPRSEWVNRTRVPWPLGGHMKDCFIDSVKFKRLMKVRCTCTTATLLWYKTFEWESKTVWVMQFRICAQRYSCHGSNFITIWVNMAMQCSKLNFFRVTF